MLVCSCNLISAKDIEICTQEILEENPWTLILVPRVYNKLQKAGKCCGCYPQAQEIINKTFLSYHLSFGTPQKHIQKHIQAITQANHRLTKKAKYTRLNRNPKTLYTKISV